MQQFIDLYIFLPDRNFEDFILEYSRNLPNEWTRDEEWEKEIPMLLDKKRLN